ncbi:MAG: hypothetical protein CENE_02373 [Candidatus Celerinatantimonas neptuna]|nr:MAG: hypothetical protein CENE_02373 [Candidatus Celerinatantimonas neptuna]
MKNKNGMTGVTPPFQQDKKGGNEVTCFGE